MINFNLAEAFTALNQKIGNRMQSLPNQNNIRLSRIQYEILCLITMGKSLAEISEVLSKLRNKHYSKYMIQFIIYSQLYSIFEVDSTSKLIEKTITMQMINRVPPAFLS